MNMRTLKILLLFFASIFTLVAQQDLVVNFNAYVLEGDYTACVADQQNSFVYVNDHTVHVFEYKLTNNTSTAITLNNINLSLEEGITLIGDHPFMQVLNCNGSSISPALPQVDLTYTFPLQGNGISLPANGIFKLQFLGKLDCRVGTQLDFKLLVNYIDNQGSRVYNSEDHENTSTANFRIPRASSVYVDGQRTFTYFPNKVFRRELKVTNISNAPVYRFVISYEEKDGLNPNYQTALALSSLKQGVSIQQINSTNVYEVTLTEPLIPNESVQFSETTSITSCTQTAYNIITYINLFSQSCKNPDSYTRDFLPTTYSTEQINPDIELSRMGTGATMLTGEEQTVVLRVRNKSVNSVSARVFDAYMKVSGVTVTAAQIVGIDGNSASGNIPFVQSGADYLLQMANITGSTPFEDLESGGEIFGNGNGKLDDLLPSKYFDVEIKYRLSDCSAGTAERKMKVYFESKDICKRVMDDNYLNIEVFKASFSKLVSKNIGSQDFEYNEAADFAIAATLPSLVQNNFSFANARIKAVVAIPKVLHLDATSPWGPTVESWTNSSDPLSPYDVYTIMIKPKSITSCDNGACGFDKFSGDNAITYSVKLINPQKCITYDSLPLLTTFKLITSDNCELEIGNADALVYRFSSAKGCTVIKRGTGINGTLSELGIAGDTPGTGDVTGTVTEQEIVTEEELSKVATTSMLVNRTTFGYPFPAKGYYTSAELASMTPSCSGCNTKAGIANDQFKIITTGKIIGTDVKEDVQVRIKYNYDQVADQPFEVIGEVHYSIVGTSVNISTSTTVKQSRSPYNKDGYFDFTIPKPNGQNSWDDETVITADFTIRLRDNFAQDPQRVEFASNDFRANFYTKSLKASSGRGDHLNLYQFNSLMFRDNIRQSTICYSDFLTLNVLVQNGDIKDPFLGEFRPSFTLNSYYWQEAGSLVSFNGITNADFAIDYDAEGGWIDAKSNDRIPGKNLDMVFPLRQLYLRVNNNVPKNPCEIYPINFTENTKTIYEYKKYGSLQTIKLVSETLTNWGGYGPILLIDEASTTGSFAEGKESEAVWDIRVRVDFGQGDYYAKLTNLTANKIKFNAFSIDGGPKIPVTVKSAAWFRLESELLTQGYHSLKLYATYTTCQEGKIDYVNLELRATCKDKPLDCISSTDEPLKLGLGYHVPQLDFKVEADQNELYQAICNSYTINATARNVGKAKLKDFVFGIYVPSGFALDYGSSFVHLRNHGTGGLSENTAKPLAVSASTINNFDIKKSRLKLTVPSGYINKNSWFLSEYYSGIKDLDVFEQGNYDVVFSYVLKNNCSANVPINLDVPLSLGAAGTQNCGGVLWSTQNFKILESTSITNRPKLNVKPHLSAKKGVDDCAPLTVTLNVANKDYKEQEEYTHNVMIQVQLNEYYELEPESSIPVEYSSDGPYINYMMSAATFTSKFKVRLKAGVTVPVGYKHIFKVVALKDLAIDMCSTATAACKKVYVLVGTPSKLTIVTNCTTTEIPPKFTGPTQLCTPPLDTETQTWRYTYSPHLAGNVYTNWHIPTVDATFAPVSPGVIDVTYTNVSSHKGQILGKVGVDVTKVGTTVAIPYELTVEVLNPAKPKLDFDLLKPCPDKPVFLNEKVRVRIHDEAFNSGEMYSFDITGDLTAEYESYDQEFDMLFTKPGKQVITLLGRTSGLFCQLPGSNTITVDVLDVKLNATQGYLCTTNPNDRTTLTVDMKEEDAAKYGQNILWYHEGNLIPNAGGLSYVASLPGKYTVVFKDLSCPSTLFDYHDFHGSLDLEKQRRIQELFKTPPALGYTAFASADGGASVQDVQEVSDDLNKLIFLSLYIKAKECFTNHTYQPPGGPGGPGSSCYNCDCIDNCMKGFVPKAGETFHISTWVYEQTSPIDPKRGAAGVQVVFQLQGGGTQVLDLNNSKEKVSIDGWQQVSGNFTVPAQVLKITIRLKSSTDYDIFYDDIRLHPLDASVKSFVYEPNTLKLAAVLDENNYASYYEYDNEGHLVRVKKETERGIMTIQESRENLMNK